MSVFQGINIDLQSIEQIQQAQHESKEITNKIIHSNKDLLNTKIKTILHKLKHRDKLHEIKQNKKIFDCQTKLQYLLYLIHGEHEKFDTRFCNYKRYLEVSTNERKDNGYVNFLWNIVALRLNHEKNIHFEIYSKDDKQMKDFDNACASVLSRHKNNEKDGDHGFKNISKIYHFYFNGIPSSCFECDEKQNHGSYLKDDADTISDIIYNTPSALQYLVKTFQVYFSKQENHDGAGECSSVNCNDSLLLLSLNPIKWLLYTNLGVRISLSDISHSADEDNSATHSSVESRQSLLMKDYVNLGDRIYYCLEERTLFSNCNDDESNKLFDIICDIYLDQSDCCSKDLLRHHSTDCILHDKNEYNITMAFEGKHRAEEHNKMIRCFPDIIKVQVKKKKEDDSKEVTLHFIPATTIELCKLYNYNEEICNQVDLALNDDHCFPRTCKKKFCFDLFMLLQNKHSPLRMNNKAMQVNALHALSYQSVSELIYFYRDYMTFNGDKSSLKGRSTQYAILPLYSMFEMIFHRRNCTNDIKDIMDVNSWKHCVIYLNNRGKCISLWSNETFSTKQTYKLINIASYCVLGIAEYESIEESTSMYLVEYNNQVKNDKETELFSTFCNWRSCIEHFTHENNDSNPTSSVSASLCFEHEKMKNYIDTYQKHQSVPQKKKISKKSKKRDCYKNHTCPVEEQSLLLLQGRVKGRNDETNIMKLHKVSKLLQELESGKIHMMVEKFLSEADSF